jgi:hypothetical protein
MGHLTHYLLIAVVLLGWVPTQASATAIAAADSQLLAERFARIRRSPSVAIFHVGGRVRDCSPLSLPEPGGIDCHPIIQKVIPPSSSWGDSVVTLLTAPGALVRPQAKGPICPDNIVLCFTTEDETTTVWASSSCGTIGVPTPVSVMGLAMDRGLESFRALLYSAIPKLDFASQNVQEHSEDPPRLITKPDLPPSLRLRNPAWVDSVVFDAVIGKDGRVSKLVLERSVPGLDSLAAAYVSRYVYTGPLTRNRPVAVRSVITLEVPRARR